MTWKDEFNKVVAQINTANGFISPPSEWLEYANCSMNIAVARIRLCYDCNKQFIEDEDNYKQGWVSTKCNGCIEGLEDLNYSDNICSLRKSLGTHNYDNGNIGCWCLE
tara:strand:+ start:1317 stop:1640 length:324 start_codon:yes stop_codon:yes gene_type:complete